VLLTPVRNGWTEKFGCKPNRAHGVVLWVLVEQVARAGIGLPCNNYGHADIQGSPLRVEAPDFKRAWKLPGGIGIIPSSKGITIFRHDTGYYKRFSEQNKPSTCEYSYFDATAKIWYCRVSDYNFYTENPIGYNFQTRENNKTGGFRIFAYDFSYTIYGKPNVDYKN
jgi:hypothetical protein